MSPVVTYNPKSEDRPYLPHEGIYGAGQENDADVEVQEFIYEVPEGRGPYDDRDCQNDRYSQWVFRVVYNGTMVFARSRHQAHSENSGSRNLSWAKNLLGEDALVEQPDGSVGFDSDQLAGIKCAIRVRAPNQSKKDGRWFTGDVVDVFGLQG